VFAQAPQKMTYQAVVRNSSNALVQNTTIGMKVTLLQGSITGTVVYVETHTALTNDNGLLNIEIGGGAVVSGTYQNGIYWDGGPYFLKTEIDPLGGTNYTITATSELLSVPYSNYSHVSGIALNSWRLLGIAGTVDNTHFIGTTDNIPFNIRVNNQKAGRIDHLQGNSFWGYLAGSNTTGGENTANGTSALFSNTGGYNNTANGANALFSNTTGYYNVANGSMALFSNTTGYENTATGLNALLYNTTGGNNTANGSRALGNNTTGNHNTANGDFALHNNTTGNYNTANGNRALLNNTTGHYNTALGYQADVAPGSANATAIGANAMVNASNKIRLGSAAVTNCEVPVNWTIVSDKNLKTDIKYDIVGLNFINKLQPASYKYIAHDANAPRFTGLLAQDVDAILQKLGIESSIVSKPNADGTGSWGIRYAELTLPLIKAVQEQQEMIVSLKTDNEKIKTDNEKIKAELAEIKALLNSKANK